MQNSIQDAGQLDAIDRGIIDILRQHPSGCAARQLLAGLEAQGHKISQPTLSRRLTKLESARHVVARKAGRSTRYERDLYHDWFSVSPTRRKKVSYNFACLDGYEPNRIRWLTPGESNRLTQAGGGRRLNASTYARAIAQKLLVDLSYASSALEGNTYSYLDTQVLIEHGQAAQGKDLIETQMILNHKDAINYLIENVADIEVSTRELRTLHALLARNMPNVRAGEIGAVRHRLVDGIGGSAYLPLAIPQKLEEELAKVAAKAHAIDAPFEQSLFLMAFISYLQAFVDVNKRTARLACNIPLLKSGLAPFSFIDVDKAKYVEGLLAFYELNRIDILKEAYVEGYVASAARYDAYAARDKDAIELEFRRRSDIYGCIKAFMERSVQDRARGDLGAFARDYFQGEPEEVRLKLAERVSDIVEALNDANAIAYGIPRDLFENYLRLSKVGGGAAF
ncbi:MAG: Fic family protein [Alphaproteobacteria bacterium]